MNKIILTSLLFSLLAFGTSAEENVMKDLEQKSQKIIEKYDHHIQRLREKNKLNSGMKALLTKQAEEMKNLKLKHLNERYALKMKHKEQTATLRNADNPDDKNNLILLYEEEIDVLTPVNMPEENKPVKNPNRHLQK